jgi:hypothetical protein
MIGLFTKCSRGWFWELLLWLLVLELPGGSADMVACGGINETLA